MSVTNSDDYGSDSDRQDGSSCPSGPPVDYYQPSGRKYTKKELTERLAYADAKAWSLARKRQMCPLPLPAATERRIRQWFELVDGDGSGQLNAADLEFALKASGIPANSNAVAEMIKMFDFDQDGEIAWREFHHFLSYEVMADKDPLGSDYVLPSGMALPLGSMIDTIRRRKMLDDVQKGGSNRDFWASEGPDFLRYLLQSEGYNFDQESRDILLRILDYKPTAGKDAEKDAPTIPGVSAGTREAHKRRIERLKQALLRAGASRRHAAAAASGGGASGGGSSSGAAAGQQSSGKGKKPGAGHDAGPPGAVTAAAAVPGTSSTTSRRSFESMMSSSSRAARLMRQADPFKRETADGEGLWQLSLLRSSVSSAVTSGHAAGNGGSSVAEESSSFFGDFAAVVTAAAAAAAAVGGGSGSGSGGASAAAGSAGAEGDLRPPRFSSLLTLNVAEGSSTHDPPASPAPARGSPASPGNSAVWTAAASSPAGPPPPASQQQQLQQQLKRLQLPAAAGAAPPRGPLAPERPNRSDSSGQMSAPTSPWLASSAAPSAAAAAALRSSLPALTPSADAGMRWSTAGGGGASGVAAASSRAADSPSSGWGLPSPGGASPVPPLLPSPVAAAAGADAGTAAAAAASGAGGGMASGGAVQLQSSSLDPGSSGLCPAVSGVTSGSSAAAAAAAPPPPPNPDSPLLRPTQSVPQRLVPRSQSTGRPRPYSNSLVRASRVTQQAHVASTEARRTTRPSSSGTASQEPSGYNMGADGRGGGSELAEPPSRAASAAAAAAAATAAASFGGGAPLPPGANTGWIAGSTRPGGTPRLGTAAVGQQHQPPHGGGGGGGAVRLPARGRADAAAAAAEIRRSVWESSIAAPTHQQQQMLRGGGWPTTGVYGAASGRGPSYGGTSTHSLPVAGTSSSDLGPFARAADWLTSQGMMPPPQQQEQQEQQSAEAAPLAATFPPPSIFIPADVESPVPSPLPSPLPPASGAAAAAAAASPRLRSHTQPTAVAGLVGERSSNNLGSPLLPGQTRKSDWGLKPTPVAHAPFWAGPSTATCTATSSPQPVPYDLTAAAAGPDAQPSSAAAAAVRALMQQPLPPPGSPAAAAAAAAAAARVATAPTAGSLSFGNRRSFEAERGSGGDGGGGGGTTGGIWSASAAPIGPGPGGIGATGGRRPLPAQGHPGQLSARGQHWGSPQRFPPAATTAAAVTGPSPPGSPQIAGLHAVMPAPSQQQRPPQSPVTSAVAALAAATAAPSASNRHAGEAVAMSPPLHVQAVEGGLTQLDGQLLSNITPADSSSNSGTGSSTNSRVTHGLPYSGRARASNDVRQAQTQQAEMQQQYHNSEIAPGSNSSAQGRSVGDQVTRTATAATGAAAGATTPTRGAGPGTGAQPVARAAGPSKPQDRDGGKRNSGEGRRWPWPWNKDAVAAAGAGEGAAQLRGGSARDASSLAVTGQQPPVVARVRSSFLHWS